MSTSQLLDAGVVQDEWTMRFLFLPGIVILAYDHLLTCGSEVKYIWTSGRRRSALWYLFIRYFAICVNMIMITLIFGNLDSETCWKLNAAHGVLLIVQELFVGCTLIMRVLAMYGFDKRVVFILVSAEMIQFGVGAWSLVPHRPPPPDDSPLPGCHTPNSRAQDMRTSESPHRRASFTQTILGMAIAWESQLAGDLILLAFTLYSGYSRSRGAIFPPGSLWRVLVRDGTMYFGIICIANLANIIMYYVGTLRTPV
ncbi:hypothetical protein FB451DRAFT_1298098 [Mycena latifolia]|nr:hypothetical protein FB451DRAFT_1298098 [Mycena latifolia]